MDNDFARPIAALFLLGLLWLAFEIGMVDSLARWILSPLAPTHTRASVEKF